MRLKFSMISTRILLILSLVLTGCSQSISLDFRIDDDCILEMYPIAGKNLPVFTRLSHKEKMALSVVINDLITGGSQLPLTTKEPYGVFRQGEKNYYWMGDEIFVKVSNEEAIHISSDRMKEMARRLANDSFEFPDILSALSE